MHVTTLDQLADVMRSYPITGIIPRTEYEKFQVGGEAIETEDGITIVVSHNYRTIDPYSPTQRIQIDGMSLSVYVEGGRQESGVCHDPDTLHQFVQDLATKARKLCAHTYGRELGQRECREKGIGHFGNCWHVYECGKCHEIFSVDSSG